MSNDWLEGKDTICAVATPHGRGGISVVRITGSNSIFSVRKLALFLPKQLETHSLYHGNLTNQYGQILDEVVVGIFFENKSFTGEETVEISCHGSPIITSLILKELVDLGCRMARPGEFSFRAFLNGKLDLVQAEGILSLIESNSAQAARLALRQLDGELSVKLIKIESDLIDLLAHIEADIDFSTEGLSVISPPQIMEKTKLVAYEIESLIQGFNRGRRICDGVHLVLAGQPNVGKSSLLNCMVGQDKAIVTDIPGTTRDIIEGQYYYNGIKFNLHDTAGLRESQDAIENLGINRAMQAIERTDLILMVVDGSETSGHIDGGKKYFSEMIQKIGKVSSPIFLLLNKNDLVSSCAIELPNGVSDCFFVSAKNGDGIEKLKMRICEELALSGEFLEPLVSNARHYEGLVSANKTLGNILKNPNTGMEFLAVDLREALVFVQNILGKQFQDDILDRIFSSFCIGK